MAFTSNVRSVNMRRLLQRSRNEKELEEIGKNLHRRWGMPLAQTKKKKKKAKKVSSGPVWFVSGGLPTLGRNR